MKRFLSILLAAMLLLSTIPVGTATTDVHQHEGEDHLLAEDGYDHAHNAGVMLLADECPHANMGEWRSSLLNPDQHLRYCDDCTSYREYADHRGGTATCVEKAVCEDCGKSYGDYSTDHQWVADSWYSYDEHVIVCQEESCTAVARAPHYGGDGSCRPTCEGCNELYRDAAGEHRGITAWQNFDDLTHYRRCTTCNDESTYEYVPHVNADSDTSCDDCGTYICPHTNMSDWYYADTDQHYRECDDCWAEESIEYASHADETGDGLCDGCYHQMSTACQHTNMSNWGYLSNTQHYRYCNQCLHYKEYGDHYANGLCFGTCTVCNAVSFAKNGAHTLTPWIHASATQHMRLCDTCYDDATQEHADHVDENSDRVCDDCSYAFPCQHANMGVDTIEGLWHRLYCLDCNDPATYVYEDHYGGTATCSTRAVCEGCGTSYGSTTAHLNMSDWAHHNDVHHSRYCTDCGLDSSYEYEGHYTDIFCYGPCAACGTYTYNSNGEHSMTQWTPSNDDTQHYRYCERCQLNDTIEYADHADETGDGLCDGCGSTMPCQHTNMSAWYVIDSTQHFRYCPDCNDPSTYEYVAHFGGTANCLSGPSCEACGAGYGSPTGVHLNMSNWFNYDEKQHRRICYDCGLASSYEYADHYTDGPCIGFCVECGTQAYDPNGEHTLGDDCYQYNSTQHSRVCIYCREPEFADHYDETGDGLCDGCSYRMYTVCQHTNMGYWVPIAGGKHYRYCHDCSDYTEVSDHIGEWDACLFTCEVCGYSEIDQDVSKHNMSDWQPYDDERHYRMCSKCEGYQLSDHRGGTATCADKAICEVCGGSYGDTSSNHRISEWIYMDNTQHFRHCEDCVNLDTYEYGAHTSSDGACKSKCDDCGGTFYNTNATKHSLGTWRVFNGESHVRVCVDCGDYAEYADHRGGTATCTTPAVCEDCGEILTEQLGHNYVAVVTQPACKAEGYTTHTCTRCQDSYKTDYTAALNHWYGLWSPNADGTHSAECKRSGCQYVATTECTLYEVTVATSETVLTVCPVCGNCAGTAFAIIPEALIKAVGKNNCLTGDQIVRGTEAPFDGVLYAFTVAQEYAGKVEPFNGTVSVTLPLDETLFTGFKLMRVDVTPATEDAVRTEVWTEVAFDYQNSQLTFNADAAGLYLLVPAE